MTLTRGKRIGLTIAALLAISGIVWNLDLIANPDFWSALGRVLLNFVMNRR